MPLNPALMLGLALVAGAGCGDGAGSPAGRDAQPLGDGAMDAPSGGDALPDATSDGEDRGSTSCGPAGFFWENPLPQGDALVSTFGLSPTDLWAVGVFGTLLHFDGTTWSCVASPTTSSLRAVWGARSDELWAAGGDGSAGVILHGDGRAWSVALRPSFALAGLGGSGPSDVWAVGAGGAILHWDGSTWSPSPSGTTVDLVRVFAGGPRDAWAVGYAQSAGVARGGLILHWDGARWSVAESGAGAIGVPTSVSGSAPDDVWVVGSCDTVFGACSVLHWDGRAWSRGEFETPYPDNGEFLNDVVALGPDDVWALGQLGSNYHFDGARWSAVPSCEGDDWGNEIAAWGTAADLWAVGSPGNLCHWDGSRWTRKSGGILADLTSVQVTDASAAWAVGATVFIQPDRSQASASALLRWDGRGWAQVAQTQGGGFNALWASAASDVWVVGEAYCTQGVATYPCGKIWHYDGASLAEVPGLERTDPILAIWGSGADDLWAVGAGTLLHGDGRSWTVVEQHSGVWHFGVWGSAANDVWVVGADGQISHFDGNRWSDVASPTSSNLLGVSGSGPSDVWAVGARGTLLHWDGARWQGVPSPVTDALYSVWTDRAGQVWAVGGDVWGVILRHDGAGWLVDGRTGNAPLLSVHGTDEGTLRVVGRRGAILHHAPAR
jgi:hypothetical protein